MSQPPTPRPITPAASAAAWAEPSVRTWMLVSIFSLVLAVVVGFLSIRSALRHADLLRNGTRVQAVVTHVLQREFVTNLVRDKDLEITIRYTLPGEFDPKTADVLLPRDDSKTIGVDQKIELVIDPNDASETKRATDRLTPKSWRAVLTIPVVLLLAGVAALGLTLRRRAGRLKLFAHGDLRQATVVDVQRSAVAPGSLILKVALDDSDDRRLIPVAWPKKLGDVGRESSIQLLCDSRDPRRAIVAAAYGL